MSQDIYGPEDAQFLRRSEAIENGPDAMPRGAWGKPRTLMPARYPHWPTTRQFARCPLSPREPSRTAPRPLPETPITNALLDPASTLDDPRSREAVADALEDVRRRISAARARLARTLHHEDGIEWIATCRGAAGFARPRALARRRSRPPSPSASAAR